MDFSQKIWEHNTKSIKLPLTELVGGATATAKAGALTEKYSYVPLSPTGRARRLVLSNHIWKGICKILDGNTMIYKGINPNEHLIFVRGISNPAAREAISLHFKGSEYSYCYYSGLTPIKSSAPGDKEAPRFLEALAVFFTLMGLTFGTTEREKWAEARFATTRTGKVPPDLVFYLCDMVYTLSKENFADYNNLDSYEYKNEVFDEKEFKDITAKFTVPKAETVSDARGCLFDVPIVSTVSTATTSQTSPVSPSATQEKSKKKKAAPASSSVDYKEYRLVEDSELTPEEKLLVPTCSLDLVQEKVQQLVADIHRRHKQTRKLNNILLYGEAGSGKSHSAMQIAKILNLPYRFVNFENSADSTILKGAFEPSDEVGKFIRTEPAFLKTYREGGVIELVEFNWMKPSELGVLQSALDEKNKLQLENGEIIERHPNCIVIGTLNVGYAGCQQVNPATRSRFQRIIEIKKLSDRQLISIIETELGVSNDTLFSLLVKLMHQIENYVSSNFVDGVVSARYLIEWADAAYHTGNVVAAAEDTILSGVSFDEETRNEIIDVIKATANV